MIDKTGRQALERLEALENSLAWQTSCTQCAGLLSQLYDADEKLDRVRELRDLWATGEGHDDVVVWLDAALEGES